MYLFFFQAFPILQGDMDASGNLNAVLYHAFTESLRSKLIAQVSFSLSCLYRESKIKVDSPGKPFSTIVQSV